MEQWDVFWNLEVFAKSLAAARPEMHEVMIQIAELIGQDRHEEAAGLFSTLPSLSIDHALMERSASVFVVPSAFEWDDLGSWDSLPRTLGLSEEGNCAMGEARFLDSSGCVVRTDGPRVNLLGVTGLIVVVSGDEVLAAPKAMAQDVRRLAP